MFNQNILGFFLFGFNSNYTSKPEIYFHMQGNLMGTPIQ